MCSRPAVSTSTRSAPRLDGRGHRVEHDRARDRRPPGRARARRRCARPRARAARRRRRGTCRPRRARRGGRRRPRCGASLPIVVVFPTPLTPTNIHTFGSPAASVQRRGRRSPSSSATTSSRSSAIELVGVRSTRSSLARVAHRVEDRVVVVACRRRRAATPPRARPTSRRRSCGRGSGRTRPRTPCACRRGRRAVAVVRGLRPRRAAGRRPRPRARASSSSSSSTVGVGTVGGAEVAVVVVGAGRFRARRGFAGERPTGLRAARETRTTTSTPSDNRTSAQQRSGSRPACPEATQALAAAGHAHTWVRRGVSRTSSESVERLAATRADALEVQKSVARRSRARRRNHGHELEGGRHFCCPRWSIRVSRPQPPSTLPLARTC